MAEPAPVTVLTAPGQAPDPPAVELSDISKRFGTTVALDGVDLAIQAGQVTALLGENGAGKSTLMRILVGLLPADAGEIRLNARPVVIGNARQAARLGLAMVHQHLALVDALTVWENVILGESGPLRRVSAIGRVHTVGERFGIDVDPHAVVGDMPAGMRQRVELIRCLAREPSVLVLDEPTAVLTVAEARQLFAVLRTVVRDRRVAVILISHKLDEALNASDSVVVMRRGRVTGRHLASATSVAELGGEMVGGVEVAVRAIAAVPSPDRGTNASAATAPALRLRRLATRATLDAVPLQGVDLEVGAGEVVGLAGVEGNGQIALEEVFANLVTASAGGVEVGGRDVTTGRPGAMQRAGVSLIPTEMQRGGGVLDMSLEDNLILDTVDQYSRHGWLDRERIRRQALTLIAEYGIEPADPRALLRSLSGGNRQRVVLARELSRRPSVLVAANVARGLDVGATAQIHQRLGAAAAAGAGVLLISSELDELLELCHRIAVINRGRVVGEVKAGPGERERLGLLMGGQPA